jgi:DNA-directed RNA polymerase specialized sigma24 family protein
MDRDDILQNTLLVVAEKLEQPDMNPPRFALTVMRNKIGDALRAQASGRRVESMDESPDDSDRAPVPGFAAENPDPADTIDRGMLAVRIRTVITKMSKFCQAFFLAALEGREIGEVWELATATEPQLKRSAFDKRIFDCRQRLRKELEGYI